MQKETVTRMGLLVIPVQAGIAIDSVILSEEP